MTLITIAEAVRRKETTDTYIRKGILKKKIDIVKYESKKEGMLVVVNEKFNNFKPDKRFILDINELILFTNKRLKAKRAKPKPRHT